MDQAHPGDLFRASDGAAKLWRVVAVRPSAYELECVEAPNLSRFATPEKLFNPHHYRPARAAGDDEVR